MDRHANSVKEEETASIKRTALHTAFHEESV